MSKTIDQRVVEMRFDSKHFESNVSTTMSTLDKLKQKLHLDGASKGLENVGAAAKNVDMSGLGRGIETVSSRFSALEVMGVTALANITNSAVNAGKRIVSALTIDPIKTGFSEYETKINAIQTIMSNTASKGTTMADVTRVIDELNTYADKTIYNFAEMTRNIGTFTAAGVGLEESAAAIQGIANLAAASGSNSQQASTAMYQLSQALAAGTVKLMDWNSVVNAGMGGEKFQEALKATAREHGVAVDQIIKSSGSFRDSLKEEWVTAEILNTTLKKFTTEGAKEYAESMVASGKYTREQADALIKEAEAMEDAATKVKTLTQLWDTLKESAQSGWSKTWELIFGDFEEAKELFTGLSDFLGGFINKMSDARNFLIEGALDLASPWNKITEKLENSGLGKIKDIAKTVSDATDKLEYFQDIVNKVWRGDYKNSDTGRYQLLEKAGYDHRVVQDLVNKGYQYKITVEDIEASHKKFGLTMSETSKETAKTTVAFNELSDEQLKNAGLTEDEIRLYRDLAEEAERTGVSIEELVEEMSKNDGRTLLIDSFKNAGQGLVAVFTAIKDAWVEIFPPMSVVKLYSIIKGINEFSQHLRVGDETADKLKRTLKGVFAIIDIITTILGGGLKIAFKLVTQILGYFNLDILEATALVGDAIVKFRDWFDSIFDVTGLLDVIVPSIKSAADAVGKWVGKIKESEKFKDFSKWISDAGAAIKDFFANIPYGDIFSGFVAGVSKVASVIANIGSAIAKTESFVRFVENLKNAGSAIKTWFSSLKESDNIPRDILLGLINSLKNGVGLVVSSVIDLGKAIITGICEVLGIQSPSTEFAEIGGNIIAGLVQGLKDGAAAAYEFIKAVGNKLIEIVKNTNLAEILATITGLAVTGVIVKLGTNISKAIGAFAKVTDKIGDMFEGIGDMFEGIGAEFKAKAWERKANAIKSFAIAIAILAASVYVLAKLDTGKLWGAIGALAALAAIIVLLSLAFSKIPLIDSKRIGEIAMPLLGISAALVVLSFAMSKLADLSWDDMARGGVAIIGLSAILVGLMAATKLVGSGIDKVGGMLIKASIALLLMAFVAKIVSSLDAVGLVKGGAAILALGVIFTIITAMVNAVGSNIDKVGSTLLKMSLAMLLLIVVAKLAASLDAETLIKGGAVIIAFGGIITGLIAATKLAGDNIDKIGSTILGISAAMLLMGFTLRMVSGLDAGDLTKGVVAIAALGGIITGLIAATKLAGGELKGVGVTLLAMSISIGVLGLVATLLSYISIGGLIKGITAVGLLGVIMAGMILATKDAKACTGNIIAMSAAIGIMAIAVVILSRIDGSQLAGAVIAISIVMGMFALILKMGSNIETSLGVLIVMTVAIGVLAGALSLLGKLPIESVLSASISLALLLGVLSGAILILSKIQVNIGNALLGVIALTLMAVPLIAFVGVLAVMQGVQNAMINVVALTTLAAAMTLLLIPLSTIGVLIGSTGGLMLLGIVALTAMVVPLIAFVGVLAAMQGIENASTNVGLLITLMTVMTTMLVAVSIVAPLAMVGVTAMAALSALIVAIGALVIGIGALMTEFPALQEFLNVGIPVLEQLAHAIGSFIGNLIAGFTEAVASSLPILGSCLSQFMLNAMPFIAGVKMVDSTVLAGVGILAGAVLALTAVDLITGIASFIQGGSSFAQLGTELSMFMMNAMPFILGASMLNAEMLGGVKALAETVLILTAAGVIDGLTSWLTGGSSFADFAAQLPVLGTGLRGFLDAIGTFSEEQVTTIKCAANAVKALAAVASEIPNTGGLLAQIVGDNQLGTFAAQFPTLGTGLRGFLDAVGTFSEEQVATVKSAADAVKTLALASAEIPNMGGWLAQIVGDNGLGTFAAQFPALGTGLRGFLDAIGTFTDEQLATITCAANAVKTLASASAEIPNMGGWLAQIVGDNGLGTFAAQFPALGTGLRGFIDNAGTFTEEQVATIKCAADSVKSLAAAASTIPNSGGWIAKLVGENNLGTFGSQFPKLGTGLKGFVAELGTFTDAELATVRTAITAINALANMANLDIGTLASYMTSFGEAITTLGNKLTSFFSSLAAISPEAISTSINNIKRLISFFSSASMIDTQSIQNFGNALKSLANNGIESFVNAFSGVVAHAKIKSAIKKTVQVAADTVTDNKGMLEDAWIVVTDWFIEKGLASREADIVGMFQKYPLAISKALTNPVALASYRSIGTMIVSGIADGISSGGGMLISAARSVVSAALAAMKAEAKIASPSKITREYGEYVGEGFVLGIEEYASTSYKAGSGIADSAKSGLNDAISKVRSFIDSDADYQPTIRPVLDLSDVESGAGVISGLFNNGPSLAVAANVGAISSMMNQRQNGKNDDIVSAINKLRKDIGGLERSQYIFGDITYDDGSTVADAVGTLVRAVKVGRRT